MVSRLQNSPVPWAPARQTRPASTRKRGHEAVGSQGPPAAPRSRLTFSPFSPGRPATPGSPCRLRPSQTAVAPRGVGAGAGRLCWPVTPASPAPTRDAQTAGEGDMLALTTPPRGPVFPGKPWRKRGVRGLVSSDPGEAGSTGSPQPRLLATRPSAALPLTARPPTPGSLGTRRENFSHEDLRCSRISLPSTDSSRRVLRRLSLVFSSPIWYLVSLDAWQALGPWNSGGTLFPLGALRRKETRGISQMRCPDVLPMPIPATLHLLVGLEGLAAPLAPSHRGHPEMESEGHIRALSRGSLALPDPRPCGQGALHSCCHRRGGPGLHFRAAN